MGIVVPRRSWREIFLWKSQKDRQARKAVEKPGQKNALGNQKAISTFRTASTTTSLTIVITFWKMQSPASLRSED